MTTHFNLAILTDNTASNRVIDAPASETGVPDPGPSTLALEEETICKAPHLNSCANKRNRPMQLTGVVLLTYRGEPGPVRGIPAGYKSDNSWDFSDAGEQDCSNRRNITPLLAYTSWRGHPNRGWEQSYGQGNNIAVLEWQRAPSSAVAESAIWPSNQKSASAPHVRLPQVAVLS